MGVEGERRLLLGHGPRSRREFQQAMAAPKIIIASGMDVLTFSYAITLTAYGYLIEGKDREAAEVKEHNFALLQTE